MRRAVTALLAACCLVPTAVVLAQKGPQTATQFYVEYRAAWTRATSIDAVLPYLAKDMRAKVEATPKDQRAQMFEMMKSIDDITDIKVVKETKTADGYSLEVTATGSEKKAVKGTVDIVSEGGAMKLRKESWQM